MVTTPTRANRARHKTETRIQQCGEGVRVKPGSSRFVCDGSKCRPRPGRGGRGAAGDRTVASHVLRRPVGDRFPAAALDIAEGFPADAVEAALPLT